MGVPPVLNKSDAKLKDIEAWVVAFEGSTFDSSEDASDYLCEVMRELRKILDR